MEVESTTSHTDLCYNSATSHLQILDSHPAIIDSGTTGHFLLCNALCNNRHPTNNPITCQLPTGITEFNPRSQLKPAKLQPVTRSVNRTPVPRAPAFLTLYQNTL
jgi:hypothetical protein